MIVLEGDTFAFRRMWVPYGNRHDDRNTNVPQRRRVWDSLCQPINVPHAIAVDSRGNIYVGENSDGRRFQRLFKGMRTPKPGMSPPMTLVR